MTEIDKDLLSIQEARTLATQAREAQRKFLHATQAEVDRICAAMAQAASDAALPLARMASEETGFGVPEHKVLKNQLASQLLWNEIKDIPTVGVVRNDPQKGTYDIAWLLGVIVSCSSFHQSNFDRHFQNTYRGQSAQCNCHRTSSFGYQMHNRNHAHHGRSGRTRRHAKGIDLDR